MAKEKEFEEEKLDEFVDDSDLGIEDDFDLEIEDDNIYDDNLDENTYDDNLDEEYDSYQNRNQLSQEFKNRLNQKKDEYLKDKIEQLKNRNRQQHIQDTTPKLNQKMSNPVTNSPQAGLNNVGSKALAGTETATGAGTAAAGTAATGAGTAAASTAAAGAGTAAASTAAAGAGTAASGGLAALMANPYFWLVVAIIVVVLIIVIIIICVAANADNNQLNSNSVVSQDSAISLTRTELTKEEFVAACDTQTSHREFYGKCDKIYTISIENNFNPEMVVIRARVEGFSPGSVKNNYWGLGCYNTNSKACISYGSFEEGVKAFIKNVSQYESVEKMVMRYANIGSVWYNPGGSGIGGCYYFPYISQYMSSSRSSTVSNYCNASRACSKTSCQPTNDEDQEAYAKWQVANMVASGNKIFGKVTSDTVTNEIASKDAPTKVDDLKKRYYFTFDIEEYLGYERGNNALFAQCVWYASHRAMDIINSSNLSKAEKEKRIAAVKSRGGNGGEFATKMSDVFKKTKNIDDIVAPAVISWEKKGDFGHVGIIEKITKNPDGSKTYYITEGWRTRDCGTDWCTHDYLTELWKLTNFNSTTKNSVATYGTKYTFFAATSLLE